MFRKVLGISDRALRIESRLDNTGPSSDLRALNHVMTHSGLLILMSTNKWEQFLRTRRPEEAPRSNLD